ncbi:MAG: glycosyltransferase family 39 protein [bacterium]|nr:glycosyltransferase family 39 protein [bacterium]
MNRKTSYFEKHTGLIALIFAMVFTVIVSAFLLIDKSIRLDEAQSVWQTNHSLFGTLRVIATDVHLPLYFITLRAWIIAFGNSPLAIRSLSVIFLLASFPFLYTVAKDSFTKRVAIFTLLLATVSAFLHWYGSEARMYSLLFLITTISHLFFLRLFNAKYSDRKSTWIFYALSVFIGVYTHLFFGFILIVQALFYLRNRSLFPIKSLRNFLFISAGILIQLGVWQAFRIKVGSANSSPLLNPPTTSDFFNLFSNIFIGLQGNTFNSFFLSLWPIFVIIGFSLLARREKLSPKISYLLQSAFIPIILAFVISIFVTPVFVSRYLIIIVTPLYILTAYLISLYKSRTGNVIFAVVMLSMLFSLSVEAISPNVPVNENYREAAMYVEKNAKENDIFVVSAPFTTYPIEYYYKGITPLITFPKWNRFEDSSRIPPFTKENLILESDEWAKNYEYLYLLQSYNNEYSEEVRLYLDTNYERVNVKEFSPGLNLYVYKLLYL